MPTRADTRHTRRRYAALTAAAALLLALAPQLHFVAARGRAWRGEFALAHGDEVAYAAYLNALIEGRPRKSDPYTGRDERPGAPQAESYISVQFVPPLVLSWVARLFRLDASRSLVLLTVFAALGSALALFYLLEALLGDARLACAGTLATLFLASAHQVLEYALRLGSSNNYVPFLRFYVPAAGFPVLFAYLALTLAALTRTRRASVFAALGAGVAFAALVFTYFYLWTTAAAFSLALFALWLFARRDEWRRLVTRFATVTFIALAALIPYVLLLSRRSPDTDAAQLLTRSHRPDLFRPSEIVAAAALVLLAFAARRRLVSLSAPPTIFAAACALSTFVVFNQQIVTGRSLQPFHFDLFTANYLAVLGAFVAAGLALRAYATRRTADEPAEVGDAVSPASRDESSGAATSSPRDLVGRFALAVGALALAAGALTTAAACRTRFTGNALRDDARPVALRLDALGRTMQQNSDDPRALAASRASLDTRSVVFVPDYSVADYLPTVEPQPTLWAPHMFNYSVTLAEDRERLMTWLYFRGEDFAGVTPEGFDSLDGAHKFLLSSLIGRARMKPELREDWQPITHDELRAALDSYARFRADFTRESAARYALSYVVVDAATPFDATNLDRFYERDAGERVGRFVLYRVRLR